MDFINDKETNAIDEDRIVSQIHSIKPQMTFLIICYSQILDLKFLLERTGVFAEQRLNRDLNILSNGQSLTMNEVQKEFIQTMAHQDHVEKDIVVSRTPRLSIQREQIQNSEFDQKSQS